MPSTTAEELPNSETSRNRVGILNFQYSNHNFGAVLQATALAHCVSGLGYEVEHINYIPEFDQALTPRRIAGRILQLLGFRKAKKRAKGSDVFELFRRKWLARSPLCRTADELHALSCRYNAIIVGSDQVWRPNYTIGDPLVYFLNFVNEDCRRIAYAASFGSERWPDVDPGMTANVNALLSRFDSISWREDTGVRICKEVFGSCAVHVLDPTLLVGRNFFETMISDRDPKIDRPGIVYYKLDLDPSFVKIMGRLKNNNEEILENIYFKNVEGEDYYLEVEEWLLKIKNAKFVVTDSYHCVCFSIIFNKPFVCLRNESRGYTRIESLLDRLGLSNRALSELELLERFDELVRVPIDYVEVNRKLEHMRAESLEFLIEALR